MQLALCLATMASLTFTSSYMVLGLRSLGRSLTGFRSSVARSKSTVDAIQCGGKRTTCVISAALTYLDGKKKILDGLDATEYATVDDVIGASVGGHMRHTLDHFEKCLALVPHVSSADDTYRHGQSLDGAKYIVHYDRRSRGGTVESDPLEAARVITRLQKTLEALGTGENKKEMLRNVAVSPAFLLGEGGGEGEHVFKSNLERELFFCCHHGIHHDAMMKLILANMRKSIPDRSMGVAPSTKEFQRGNEEKKAAG